MKLGYGLDIDLLPGHVPLEQWRVERPDDPILDEHLRLYNGAVHFVFDPENVEYLEFLDRCRRDSKALERALRVELRNRDVHIWTSRRSRPAYAKEYRRMGLLIRPVYLKSYDNSAITPETRMQGDDDCDVYVLHFDIAGNFHGLRYWTPSEDADDGHVIVRRRMLVQSCLLELKDFFTANYGNWQAIAQPIAEKLEAGKWMFTDEVNSILGDPKGEWPCRWEPSFRRAQVYRS